MSIDNIIAGGVEKTGFLPGREVIYELCAAKQASKVSASLSLLADGNSYVLRFEDELHSSEKTMQMYENFAKGATIAHDKFAVFCKTQHEGHLNHIHKKPGAIDQVFEYLATTSVGKMIKNYRNEKARDAIDSNVSDFNLCIDILKYIDSRLPENNPYSPKVAEIAGKYRSIIGRLHGLRELYLPIK